MHPLNTIPANEVREWATAFWPHVAGADWDGTTLSLKYGASHWHRCSPFMADSLAAWIKRQPVN